MKSLKDCLSEQWPQYFARKKNKQVLKRVPLISEFAAMKQCTECTLFSF